ncbi:gamma-glutamyltransferase [Kineococcus terrestris]|uniref:gamma-glutamyltransferase n=1 Tax=Kineococcus terrestris TaxID=2044856 RepID=UPI0034DB0DC6
MTVTQQPTTPRPSARARLSAAALALCTGLGLSALAPASAAPPQPSPPPLPAPPAPPAPERPPGSVPGLDKVPVATGYGGAVASVDADATAAGLDVLRRGGNAVDAAVATAAALGVTEPYSAGVGGGGFLLSYDAASGTVTSIDGREAAPASLAPDAFVDPATGEPYPFAELVASTLSVGVPGTPATWERALAESGTMSLAQVLSGPRALAERGFTVDETFRQQTLDNAGRFAGFTSTAELFLPGGDAPQVGSTFRNPDLAQTYRLLAEQGTAALYAGELGRAVVDTVAHPPVADGVEREVLRGGMTLADLAAYRAVDRAPTRVEHGDVEVYGTAPPSSGGSTVGEALNILAQLPGDDGMHSEADLEHFRLEAAALAFADRNRWVGDPDVQDVPLAELLSPAFAASRACLVDGERALPRPVAPGALGADGTCATDGEAAEGAVEGPSTTHLVTADAAGNVVSYTLTIEQTGGSGIVVPGRGFLLNNELTDFNPVAAVEGVPDPNLPGPGKRPRSSMAPTIVLRDGRPFLALGSPGGATIIGTVYGILVDRLHRGLDLPAAVAAPRVSEQNREAGAAAEPAYVDSDLGREMTARGHVLVPTAEIGAAAALELLEDGRVQAVAEPVRRGGGSAGVVRPAD